MFVIFLFHLLWRMGVTSNTENCKRINGVEFSVH